MEPFNYLMVFFASMIGYLLGIGLGYIAPEEMKPGEKYLRWLENGFFILTFLPVIYFFGASLMVLLPVVVMGILFFLNFKYRAYIAFGVFLLWFFLIRTDSMIVMLEACAIFLYGLPTGSLLLNSSPARMAKLNKKVKVR